jgi:hypothetical protein
MLISYLILLKKYSFGMIKDLASCSEIFGVDLVQKLKILLDIHPINKYTELQHW